MSSSRVSTLDGSAVGNIRRALGLSGTIAVVIGLLIIVWPLHSAVALVWLLVVQAILAGVILAGLGATTRSLRPGARVSLVVAGLVFIATGIVGIAGVVADPAWALRFFGVIVGVAWIVDGIATLVAPGNEQARSWATLFALISVIAGIFLLFSGMWGGLVLWGLFGYAMVIIGALRITHAARFSVDDV